MSDSNLENRIFKLNYIKYKLKKVLAKKIIDISEYNNIINFLEIEENTLFESFNDNNFDDPTLYKQNLTETINDLKTNKVIDTITFEKLKAFWHLNKDEEAEKKLQQITVVDTNKKPDSENINLTKKELKEEKPFDIVDFIFEKISGKWFVFVGVILMVISSFPIISEMNSTSLIFFILLLYSNGLFVSGYFTRKYFLWTGNVFYLVTLLVSPIILASSSILNFNNLADLAIASITLISIPFINNIILKTLYKKLRLQYFSIFIFLSISSLFTQNIENKLINLNFIRSDFETLISLVFFAFVFLGYKILSKDFELNEKTNNFKEIFNLTLLLIYAYLIIMMVNNVSYETYGLIAMLISGISWNFIAKIKTIDNSKNTHTTTKNLSVSGYTLSLASIIMVSHDISKLVLAGFIGTLLYLLNSDLYTFKFAQIINNTLSGVFFNIFMLFLSITWNITKDIQSLLISVIMLIILLVGNINNFSKAKNALYYISVMTSIAVWVKISIFDSWSNYTLISLLIISSIYMLNSLYNKRNVFSYISIVTFTIDYFSFITILNPSLDFNTYRFYGILLAFLYLAIGYLIQIKNTNLELDKKIISEPINKTRGISLKKFINEDLINPYNFKARFISHIPYLISEPLYNVALFITSISVLVNFKDYYIAGLATIFYALIFKIYPSRLWLYFSITASSSALLNLVIEFLPSNYHNWGLVFLSFNWFFVGTLVEEFFEAYERKKDNLLDIDKKYAQPFFQGALVINILLLRHLFVDLQDVFSPQGWLKVQDEFLQLMITSFLYLLKMRVYVSKFWLYPCILVTTLVLYFRTISWIGSDYSFILLTLLGFLWLFIGNYVNKDKKILTYIKNVVFHKIPDLDTNSGFYRNHIHDFASPFYTFGLLTTSVSLLISTILIPSYILSFNILFEFGVEKLNIHNPTIFYFLQILNFVLITVFYSTFYPTKIPTLDGSYEEREKPKLVNYLPIFSISPVFFWIFNYQIDKTNILLFIAGFSLIWTIFYKVSRISEKTEVVYEEGDFSPYYLTALIIGNLSLWLNVIIEEIPKEIIQNNLLVNVISFSLLLLFSKEYYLIYFVEFILFKLGLLLSYETSLILIVLAFANLVLWAITSKKSKPISDKFLTTMNLAGGFLPLNIVFLEYTSKNLYLYSLTALILYTSIFILTKYEFFAVLGVLSMGTFFFLTSIKQEFYLLSFVFLLFFKYAFDISSKNKEKYPKLRISVFILSIVFPFLTMANYTSHIESNYQVNKFDFTSIILFIISTITLYAYLAIKHESKKIKIFLWSLNAMLINFLELHLMLKFHIMNTSLFLGSIGISFLLLSKNQEKTREKNSYLYLGQIFLVFFPYFFFKLDYEHNKYFYLIQFIFTISSLSYIGINLKRKAFIYFNALITTLFLSSELLIMFLNGSGFLRWGFLIFAGVLTIFIGTKIETQKTLIKNYFSNIYTTIKKWD